MGYETALSVGITALENGYSAAALSYLSHAGELRPGSYVLVQLAKAQRDQGLLAEARATLERARSLPNGADAYVKVSLAAILCDLGQHGEALTVALEAWKERPEDPPTLTVLARTLHEICGALSTYDHIDQTVIGFVRKQAGELEAQAKAIRPAEEQSLQERRRHRAHAQSMPPLAPLENWVPLEQEPGRALVKVAGSGAEPEVIATNEPNPAPAAEFEDESWWRRALRSLGLARRR